MFIVVTLGFISVCLVLVGIGGLIWGKETIPGLACVVSGIVIMLMLYWAFVVKGIPL